MKKFKELDTRSVNEVDNDILKVKSLKSSIISPLAFAYLSKENLKPLSSFGL